MSPTTVPGMLVVYHRPDRRLTRRRYKDAATVREHIHSFRRHSRFAVWEVNTEFGFPPGLNDVRPTVVLLHYSLFGSGVSLLGGDMSDFVRKTEAFKVAFFQDECYYCQHRFKLVNELGIDLVYTHVHPGDIPEVWGRYTPRAAVRFNYPGYVDSDMVAAAERFALPDTDRDIDVGYRGRPLPAVIGSAAPEKRVIGEQFEELAASTGLRVDIETSEEARLYGDDWYRFLGRCRAVLGVESGTSYLDLEDEVLRDYEARLAAGRAVTLEALQEGPLGRWDHNFSYRTISPRHFEAAAFRICQVLFEGEYSGVLKPMVHYIPLRKDFSNFDDVVRLLSDRGERGRIVENAHRDLIGSGRYSYERFVASVDRDLLSLGLDPAVEPAQRAILDRTLRREQIRGRLRTEKRYLRAAIDEKLYPHILRVRKLLGIPRDLA